MPVAPTSYLTTAQTARRLECTPQTVLNLVKSGALKPAMKLPGANGTYLFDPKRVDVLAKSRAA